MVNLVEGEINDNTRAQVFLEILPSLYIRFNFYFQSGKGEAFFFPSFP